LQCDDDQDKHDSDHESLLTEQPYSNAESEATIPYEDIQAGITDDVLTQVQFPLRPKGWEKTISFG
jgi:hypothetical protein